MAKERIVVESARDITFLLQRVGEGDGVCNRRRNALAGKGQERMGGVADQNQIALIEIRNRIGVHGTPKVCAREISAGEQVGKVTTL